MKIMCLKDNCINNRSKESGAIIFITLAAMLFFTVLAAIVVDIGHARLVSARLSSVADSAALASTNELYSDLPSWINAKRAALLALKSNHIRSFTGDLNEFGTATSGHTGYKDTQELGSPYEHSEYKVENLHVKIERGYYYSTDGGCSYQFESFEDEADVDSMSEFTTSIVTEYEGVACPCNIAKVANATRVVLTLESVPTFIAAAFPGGAESFTIQEEAISARGFLPENAPTGCT